MIYRPFIDDPEYVARFQGERFIVLRASGPVISVFEDVKRRLRERFPSWPLSYLAEAHVTLCGFEKHADLDAIRALAREWAPHVSPSAIVVDGIGVFGPPTKNVMLDVRKTPQLVAMLASIRDASARRGPHFTETIPVDEWTFHMSVAYGAGLSAAEWDEVASCVAAMDVARVECAADAAEIVAFDDGREYCGGICLLGT
jgi:2'-5' RNA ligase